MYIQSEKRYRISIRPINLTHACIDNLLWLSMTITFDHFSTKYLPLKFLSLASDEMEHIRVNFNGQSGNR